MRVRSTKTWGGPVERGPMVEDEPRGPRVPGSPIARGPAAGEDGGGLRGHRERESKPAARPSGRIGPSAISPAATSARIGSIQTT